MTLARVPLELDASLPLPPRVQALIDDAAIRTDRFLEERKDNPIVSFVPSDYAEVYRALHALTSTRAGSLLSGQSFCEWGSGMGVISCLASMLRLDATGIEINAQLVNESKSLACTHHFNAQFICGSYVPDGHVCENDFDESHVMTLDQGHSAYDELGLDPDDFDCIFAYPWPGEDDVVTGIFDAHAARGAILVSYHGQDGILVRRKVR